MENNGNHFCQRVYFYRLRDHTVEIARILHESMDFEQHIAESHFP